MRAKAPTTTVEVSSDQQNASFSTAPTTGKSVCPECHRPIPSIDVSEVVCTECDIVVSEPISRTARPCYNTEDWNKKKQTAGRVSPLYPDKGIGTHESLKDRPWTKDRTHSEYRLGYALDEIRRMGADFELPRSTLESAALLYRKAYNEGHVEGRSSDGFAAASLLIAVRQSSTRMPVSRREIMRTTRANKDQVRTARTVFEHFLGEEVPPMSPCDFLPKAISELCAPRKIENRARRLLKARADDADEVRSISPRTLAAAAIYTAYDLAETDESVTLPEVSDVLDVAPTTISKHNSHIRQYEETLG